VLSVLVLVHELGHFLVALALGIKVEEFAFGLPFTPALFSVKHRGIVYSIYPVLFGGFVRLYGEEGEVKLEKEKSFWSRGRKQRMAVLIAGVVMNVVLAIGAFAILYAAVGVPQKIQNKVTILGLESGGPAEVAGIKTDERIVEVEGKEISDADEFGRLMRSWAGLSVNLTVESGKNLHMLEGINQLETQRRVVKTVPRVSPPEGQGPLGVRIADFPYLTSAKCQVLSAECVQDIATAGVRATWTWTNRVIEGLRAIGKSLSVGKAPEGVAGPIAIYGLVDIISKGGFWPLLELVAVLSVNLAVFNVLPIPPMDGGKMFFIWIEWARKKKMSVELEQKINTWGMVGVLALLALVSLQDVWNLGWLANLTKYLPKR